MFLVDRQTVPAALGDGSGARLKLRVRDDGQIVELAEGKMTIGSSPRCNLRLDRPGVEPLHCLVVDGPQGLRVRRWAVDTRLNGTPVEDALLEAGDCLSLGGVELELVGPAKSVTPAPVEPSIFESHLETAAELASPELLLLEWHLEELPVIEPSVADAAPVGQVEATQSSIADLENVASEDAGQEPAVDEESCCEEARLDTANEALLAEAAVEDGEHQDVRQEPSFLNEMDAAELVFRELQAACWVARGRNRKMLSALRNLRAEKESLAGRFENSERSNELAEERAAWEAARRRTDEDQHELRLELKELRGQLGEWEGRLAENTQRMAELQQELVAARAALGARSLVHDQAAADEHVFIDPAVQNDEPINVPTAAEGEAQRGEVREPSHINSNRYESLASALPSLRNDVGSEPVQPVAVVEPSAYVATRAPDSDISDARTAWELPIERKLDWSTTEAGTPHRDGLLEVGPSRDDTAAAERASDVDPFELNIKIEAELAGKSAWAASNEIAAEDSAKENGADDISPFGEFSICKQGATPESASRVEGSTPSEAEPSASRPFTWGRSSFQSFHDNNEAEVSQSDQQADQAEMPNPWAITATEPEVSADDHVTEAEPPTAGVQSNSFIDRYSHLFAEDEALPAEKVEPPIAQAVKTPSLPAVGMTPLPPKNAIESDDDESVEQYMAKLMKRVRGEDSAAAASLTVPGTAATTDEGKVPATVSATQETPEQEEAGDSASEAAKTQEVHSEVDVNWDAFTRRAATAPTTDLGALRAIANQMARGDISRYRLKTHRRDAKTKVIVSTLAGMTSLWLMLAAPNWRDIQFITACVSLIVAAYWAGEAMREVVRSMRVAHDGPIADSAEVAALPIDVR